MVCLYIVRCNFTAPEHEAAWNSWYSGPKIVQMLEKPMFRTCQRFHRVDGRGRNYLALWTTLSPDALVTPAYTAQWGFADWSSYITDWSRDLFDGGERTEADFAAGPGDALDVVSFEGMSEPEANTARRAFEAAREMMWLPVIGLDRHTPTIGLRLRGGGSMPAAPAGVRVATYRPISEFQVTRSEPARTVS